MAEPRPIRLGFRHDEPRNASAHTTMSDATTNDWCRTLGIKRPHLEAVVGHREANTFALLLVALLEHGEPMTLLDVAARFEQADVAERPRALRSLQRCRPGRAPVYREGELYHLDPHDSDLDLWVFRLGLRPPKVARTPPPEPKSTPVPGPDTELSTEELDEAWKNANLLNVSAQRLVVAVLDAHGGPLTPTEAVAAVAGRTKWHRLNEDAAKFKRRNAAVEVQDDGNWTIATGAESIVHQARTAVRELVVRSRRQATTRTDPELLRQLRVESARKRSSHGAELASMSRAVVVAFPPSRPKAVVLLDASEHELSTFMGDELAALPSRLAAYETIGALDVRGLLRALNFEPGERRLAELGPPQKTRTINKRGRTLKITAALLVQGSCGISRPFGDPKTLAGYLAKDERAKLRRRLEADAKSLYALYEYGRLHGAVRLRWGFLDEDLPAPWVHRDEPKLYDLKRSALAMNLPIEVVVGSAPGWNDPWSRKRLAHVEQGESEWQTTLVDEDGLPIDEAEVQRARLPVAVH